MQTRHSLGYSAWNLHVNKPYIVLLLLLLT